MYMKLQVEPAVFAFLKKVENIMPNMNVDIEKSSKRKKKIMVRLMVRKKPVKSISIDTKMFNAVNGII